MTIGEYIKSLRKQQNLSQNELGKMLGVQRAAVQKWESGQVKNLKRATIQKMAKFFNVNPATFIIESDNEPLASEPSEIEALYNRLDLEDKCRAKGYIENMLESDKY